MQVLKTAAATDEEVLQVELQQQQEFDQLVEDLGIEIEEELEEDEPAVVVDLQDLLRPVPQDTSNILTGMASSKAAATIVDQLVAELQCAECTAVLHTDPEFPLHLAHTVTAAPSQLFSPQPTLQVASVVQQIGAVALEKLRPSLHRPGVVKTLVQIVNKLPAVRAFYLCQEHDVHFKPRLLHDLALKMLTEDLKRRNIAYKERNMKKPQVSQGPAKKSSKLQRVSHL